MTTAKPSLELLRELSDANVLAALVTARRATRAELAPLTGLSKPTVTESVRRLVAAGVVVDTGERTSGPGRVGDYYAVSPAVGVALAVVIAPDGVRVEAVDVHGDVVAHDRGEVRRPATPRAVARTLGRVVAGVVAHAGSARLAVVSAADPVDRVTGALVHLPDAPFLVGALSPATVLADVVEGEVQVDNDVNWSARAELASADDLDHAFHLHLGEGLGAATIADGAVRRGAHGLAGEVAHLPTTGPGGRAMPFTEVFARLGLRREGTTAIDVDAVVAALTGRTARHRATVAALGAAVAGVCAAATGLLDPGVVVLGGAWGARTETLAAVREHVDRTARPVPVRAAVVDDASAAGVREAAVAGLRRRLERYREYPPVRSPRIPPEQ